MALQGDAFLEALVRGRSDHQFFGAVFLGREPHPGQLEVLEHGVATVNVLPTSNRWGKTTVLPHIHTHSCIYKVGGEDRYFDADGVILQSRFDSLRYHTIHTAGDWETAALVWDEFHKLLKECVNLRPFVTDAPRSLPPHVNFYNGARWKFRTLGHDARGIDGNSFYVISVDEAGWIEDLEKMMQNVIRVRVADVRGRIYLVGTMKPGVSKDFFKESVRASARTGVKAIIDHRGDLDADVGEAGDLDPSIRRLCYEAGVSPDELDAALAEAREAAGV